MDFFYKTITTVLLGCILFTIPGEIYLWIFVLTGVISWEFILMVLFGKIEFKFKSNKPDKLKDTVIRFNDVENTEIYLIDIRKISKQLILSKGYVIDITTYTTDDGERLQTLRYIRKSEMNKDFEALIYKLDEYGIKYKKQIKFD